MITARRLARRFDAGHSAIQLATHRPPGLDAWLATFWRNDCPPEPDTCPDAISFLGGAGGGAVRWYETNGAVAGYLPGSPRRCFWIPDSAVEPSFDDVLDDEGPACCGDDHPLPGMTGAEGAPT